MLEVRGLTKHFGGLIAVNGLDLNVYRDEIVGLIGPNGAGKTTVFNLITGFVRPTSGSILFENEKLTYRKPHFIARKGIVRTFQAASVYSDLSVLHNIMVGSYLKEKMGFWEAVLNTSSSKKKSDRALSRCLQVLQFAEMDDLKHVIARKLTYGQKKILGICISLATEPRILLFDEPFGGMSEEEVVFAVALIKKIWERGITVLLIEHNIGAVMNLCHRMAVLDFGQKIAEGTPEEIKKDKEVIKAYLGETEYAVGSNKRNGAL